MKLFCYLLFSLLVSPAAYSWDGYDYNNGSFVEIDEGNLVREGEEIEFYDYGSGEFRTGEVQSIESSFSGAEVEIYDYESGEYRTLDMDD